MGRYTLLQAIEKFVLKPDDVRRETITEGRIISITNRRAIVDVDGVAVEMGMATDTPYTAGARVIVGKDEQGQGYILGSV